MKKFVFNKYVIILFILCTVAIAYAQRSPTDTSGYWFASDGLKDVPSYTFDREKGLGFLRSPFGGTIQATSPGTIGTTLALRGVNNTALTGAYAELYLTDTFSPRGAFVPAGPEAIGIDSSLIFNSSCTACGTDVIGVYATIVDVAGNHAQRVGNIYLGAFPDQVRGIWDNYAALTIDQQGLPNTTGFGNIGTFWGIWIPGGDQAGGNIAGMKNNLPGVTIIGTSGTSTTGVPPPALVFEPVLFANLGTPGNGVLTYCSNCTIANPCASGGSGAFAKRLNGVWVCN